MGRPTLCAESTRPRFRDDDAVRLMHLAETIARSMLPRGVRSTMSLCMVRERLKEVLIDEMGH
jgi:hypothetical protein